MYTIVKDYVRTATLRGREMFVPLTHPAGEAQVDFGEAVVVLAGVERKAHYLVMDLPHSDDCFVIAFPAETIEAFLEGHVRAFAYFGGVPTRILYDNTKIAVAKILGGTERQRTRAFSELQSHYLFADKFGRPAKGNDKGKVEGLVGYARRNFMVPIPHFPGWEAFHEHLEQQCRRRRGRRLRGHSETIGERFERDRAALLPLPIAPYEACEKVAARVSSPALVRYRGNDYSVPTRHGHLQVLVRGYVHEVTIACGSEIVARHPRSYEREAVIFDPLHYLQVLEQKTRALDQAAPLAGWLLPDCFAILRRLLEARLKKHGGREYVQVLRLLETFSMDELTHAIEDALRLGTIGIAFSHGGGTLASLLPRLSEGCRVFPVLHEAVGEEPAAQARRLFYDGLVYDDATLKHLIALFGDSQIMIGTDYPFAFQDREPVARVRRATSDPDVESRLLSRNAQRFLYGIEGNA